MGKVSPVEFEADPSKNKAVLLCRRLELTEWPQKGAKRRKNEVVLCVSAVCGGKSVFELGG